MIVFAAANWAAGYALQRLLIISAVILAVSAVGVILGARLLRSKSSTARKCTGGLLLLGSCLLPIFCYFARPDAVRLDNGTHPLGSYPGNKIREGMSGDEVKAILGPPHQRNKNNDRETWIYWTESYGGYWVGVDFGPDGRVTNLYGN